MRSAKQIGSTVSEWHELQRTERAQTLAALLAELERSHDEPWYRWILDGQPALSQAEYDEVGRFGKKRKAA